jgi:adenine-specific DNA-methyltransferase
VNQFYDYEKSISPEKKKSLGIVYTPIEVVDYINKLVLSRWEGDSPPKILDPCCGTGVFLFDMANKISERWGLTLKEVCRNYIYGFDLDPDAVDLCIKNLSGANIVCADSLEQDYSFCDLIVTNPPYVRIQNLSTERTEGLKSSYEFCVGDTDLYIAFFEKFSKCGKIAGMICPNSWIRNKSSKLLRNYLFDNNLVSHLIDFREKQIFHNVQTYTSIVLISPSDELNYSNDIEQTCRIIKYKNSSSNTLFVGGIASSLGNDSLLDYCDIKIGLATLSDGVYFGEVLKESGYFSLLKTKQSTFLIEANILRRCIKASKITGVKENTYIIFPYDHNNKLMDEEYFSKNYPLAYAYLLNNKEKLLARDKGKISPNKWYGFGRTQGLSNNKKKLLIPPFQKGYLSLRYSTEDELYISGYAVIPKEGHDIETIRSYFQSDELFSWIESNGKTMSNGWIGISKEIFKNYKFNGQKNG